MISNEPDGLAVLASGMKIRFGCQRWQVVVLEGLVCKAVMLRFVGMGWCD